jgi:hypothetical protein
VARGSPSSLYDRSIHVSQGCSSPSTGDDGRATGDGVEDGTVGSRLALCTNLRRRNISDSSNQINLCIRHTGNLGDGVGTATVGGRNRSDSGLSVGSVLSRSHFYSVLRPAVHRLVQLGQSHRRQQRVVGRLVHPGAVVVVRRPRAVHGIGDDLDDVGLDDDLDSYRLSDDRSIQVFVWWDSPASRTRDGYSASVTAWTTTLASTTSGSQRLSDDRNIHGFVQLGHRARGSA